MFNPILTSDKGIVASGAFNKYFYRGDINASGTTMRDPDTKKNRGSLFLDGRYEVNDFWVASSEINYASDSSYLKDLSLPGKTETWLTSHAALERFENRD